MLVGMLQFVMFAGFMITRAKIPIWLIEFYVSVVTECVLLDFTGKTCVILCLQWVTPLSWAIRSIVQNEFLSSDYDYEVRIPGPIPTSKRAGLFYLEVL